MWRLGYSGLSLVEKFGVASDRLFQFAHPKMTTEPGDLTPISHEQECGDSKNEVLTHYFHRFVSIHILKVPGRFFLK